MSTLSPDHVTFAEQIYSLSCFKILQNPSKEPQIFCCIGGESPRWTEGLKRKMQLLDGIALLICTGDKGDAAAVALEQGINSLKIFFCKSHPCTQEERDYIKGLLGIIQTAACGKSIVKPLLRYAIPACHEKIKSRILKIEHEVYTIGKLRGGLENIVGELTPRFQDGIRRITKARLGPGAFFVRFFAKLADAHRQMSTERILFLMSLAYSISTLPDLRFALPHPDLVRRIKKFGDYYSAAVNISRGTSENEVYAKLRNSFTLTELFHLDTVPEPITGTCGEILGRFAAQHGFSPLTLPDHLTITSDNFSAAPPRTIIHPETTLARFLMQRRRNSAHRTGAPVSVILEIGISRRICWLCTEYIRKLESHYRFYEPTGPKGLRWKSGRIAGFRVITSGHSTNIVGGWGIPTSILKVRSGVWGAVEKRVEWLVRWNGKAVKRKKEELKLKYLKWERWKKKLNEGGQDCEEDESEESGAEKGEDEGEEETEEETEEDMGEHDDGGASNH